MATEEKRLSIIASIGRNREVGFQNELLWKMPGDLPRVKKLTTGNVIIMGRKTFESIGRPLPERVNIVVTRNADYEAQGCRVVSSLDQAIDVARSLESVKEIFIFGGGELYKQSIDRVEKLYLTVVDAEAEADTFFPDYENVFSKEVFREDREHDDVKYSFVELEREKL